MLNDYSEKKLVAMFGDRKIPNRGLVEGPGNGAPSSKAGEGRSWLCAVSTLALSLLIVLAPDTALSRPGDCGTPVSTGDTPSATDALAVLNAAVGVRACERCSCDVDGSGSVVATDALILLTVAVGIERELLCEVCAGAIAPPENIEAGSAGGYVFQVNPVFVVPTAEDAPAGGVPLIGAGVRAYDVQGTLVAETTTESDGSFVVSRLRSGYKRIEVRTNPGQPAPDLAVDATIIAGTRIALGAQWPVSREVAVLAALEGVGPGTLVAGSMNPFPAGTVVYPRGNDTAGPPQNSDARTLDAPSWFFFVNPEPTADFSHDVEYVVVDAVTGSVTRIAAAFQPLVNHLPLWSRAGQLFSISDPLYFRLDPLEYPNDFDAVASPEVVQLPVLPTEENPPDSSEDFPAPFDPDLTDAMADGFDASPAQKANAEFNNTGADGVFFVAIRAGAEAHFWLNVSRMGWAMVEQGVPVENMVLGDFTDDIEPQIDTTDLSGPESLNAHRAVIRAEVEKAVLFFEPQIAERLENGDHSTLVVYLTGHGSGGAINVDFEAFVPDEEDDFLGGASPWFFKAEDLGVEKTLACRVRVIIQSCKAEQFQSSLANIFSATEHDVKIIAASATGENALATPGWTSFVPFLRIFKQGGSHFTTRLASILTIADGDLASLTTIDGNGEDLVEDLAELDGNPPSPHVRESEPPWCFPGCGNNAVEPPEQCDGTDDASCPGLCSPECNCLSEPVCGDNVKNGTFEECDGTDDTACPGRCGIDCTCNEPLCGDGILDPGEACDGFELGMCPVSCTAGCECSPPECGNDVIEPGEQCDGTQTADCESGCSNICVCNPPTCGDEIVAAPEICDGMDDNACPGACLPDCTCPDGSCGDEIVDPGEQCDADDFFCHGGSCMSDCNCDNLCAIDGECGGGDVCLSERCIAPCMGPGDCTAGELCNVPGVTTSQEFQPGCGPPMAGGGPIGSRCTAGDQCGSYSCYEASGECTQFCYGGPGGDDDCPGGACLDVIAGTNFGLCATACTREGDCDGDQVCHLSADFSENVYEGFCAQARGVGDLGDSCSDNSECDTGLCLAPPSTQAFCNSSDQCGAGETCSPFFICTLPVCTQFCESDSDCSGSLGTCTPTNFLRPLGGDPDVLNFCGP